MVSLEIARDYVRAGLCVLPARLTEKRPDLRGWKEYQSRLPTDQELQNWFAGERPACLLTGAVSGNLEMLDFDCGGELFDRWAELVQEQAPDLLDKLLIEQSQSGGCHVVYRCSEPISGNLKLAQRVVAAPNGDEVTIGGKRFRPRHVGDHYEVTLTLIETRGEGGLFLCHPSPGYTLVQGTFTALPILSAERRDILLEAAWSLNEYLASPAIAGPSGDVSGRPGDDFNERGDVRELLIKHGWSLARPGENEYWRRPGKDIGWSATLKNRVFYVFSANAAPFEQNRAYSPFSVYALLEHDGDFARAASVLRLDGYGSSDDNRMTLGGYETPADAPHSIDARKGNERSDPGPFPKHLLDVPGFMSEVMAYNLATAIRPQPVLALAAAMCLQAVLAARKVCDQRGNRTNLYAIGVADSGHGKDHGRKVNRTILFQAGLDHLEGSEDVASDAGLVAAVEQQAGVLFQIDEFGRFLRTIGDPKRAPHLFNVIGTFMKLYSSADTVFRGKAYADPKRNKVIDQPCVVLYATTVPEHFFESLTADGLSDGFVARLLVFEAGVIPARQRTPLSPPPESILAAVRWWGDYQPGGNLRAEHPVPRVVEATPEAERVFDSLAAIVDEELSRQDTGGRSLWARAEEKACRLALIYACSANRERLMIDGVAARWACELSTYLTRRMLYLASQWVSDGLFDARQKKVLRIIRAAGGAISRNDLCRKTQSLSVRERAEILDNLIATGLVEPRPDRPGVGRPKTMFALCADTSVDLSNETA